MKGLRMTAVMDRRQDRRRSTRRRTVVWTAGLATVGLRFDGCDLVAYRAVVSILGRGPAGIGQVTPAVAGTLSSYPIRLLGSAGRDGLFWTGALPVAHVSASGSRTVRPQASGALDPAGPARMTA